MLVTSSQQRIIYLVFKMAFGNQLILAFTYFLLLQGIQSLSLREVKIPQHAVRDQDAHLECKYVLSSDETLYSVKWYKDGKEFFRYVPKDNPPAQVFKLPGVEVNVSNSSETTVVLSKVSLSSSGRYRCEVSGEAPEFRTVTDHGVMIVVALPEEGPKISGGKPRYQIGDTVNVNCTSGSSNPPAQLDWYINGDKADPSLIRGPHTMFIGGDNLQKTILGLEFRVTAKHFKDGDMKLKCLASISTIYWKTNEESVKGDKPLIKVMSSQDTSLPNKSRADRVQAYGSGCRPSFPCLPLLAACGLLTLLTAVSSGAAPR